MEEKDTVSDFTGQILQASKEGIPAIYFNGFTQAMSSSDFVILLKLNNTSVASLNMSFTTAKTLLLKINELMQGFEAQTQVKIMTMDEVNNHTLPK